MFTKYENGRDFPSYKIYQNFGKAIYITVCETSLFGP